MNASQIEAAAGKLFKGAHPGQLETHLLTDKFGRDVYVTWRGGRLIGIKYVAGNSFIPAASLSAAERERWASPPLSDAAERLEAGVKREAA